jgi:hypothetical protein
MDPNAIPSKEKNPSRPAMDRAIRNEDGTEIEKAEWKNILETARIVVNKALLPLPIPSSLRPFLLRQRALVHFIEIITCTNGRRPLKNWSSFSHC